MDNGILVSIFFSVITVIAIIFDSVFVVRQNMCQIILRLGKYNRTVSAGLHLKWPLIEQRFEMTTSIEQVKTEIEAKTKDNIFVTLQVAMQYKVNIPIAVLAAWKAVNSKEVLASYLENTIARTSAMFTLDEIFAYRSFDEKIGYALRNRLDDLGFLLTNVLVTDITVADEVVAMMNSTAATYRLQAVISDIQKQTGLPANEVKELIYFTNWTETMRHASDNGNTIIFPANIQQVVAEMQKTNKTDKHV